MSSSENLKEKLDPKEIRDLLDKIESKHVFILPHESPDHDAYASAFALREVLLNYYDSNKEVQVVIPKLSLELRDFITRMNLPDFKDDTEKTLNSLPLDEKYTVFLMDTSSPSRFINKDLRELLRKTDKIIAIDHHYTQTNEVIPILLNRTSTSEIVMEIADLLGLFHVITNNRKIVNALMAAIITDTSFFYFAKKKTFENLAKIIEFGDYKQVYSSLKSTKKELSERIARIKGAKRAEMIKINDNIILITRVGSHEASVASSLINLGANIGIVISKKRSKGKTQYRVIGRSTGFDLASFFKKLGDELGGSGGGHATAAGLTLDDNIVKDENELSKLIIKRLVEQL